MILEITSKNLDTERRARNYLHNNLDKLFDELMNNLTTKGRIEISIKYEDK